jgi:hypothetical protein
VFVTVYGVVGFSTTVKLRNLELGIEFRARDTHLLCGIVSHRCCAVVVSSSHCIVVAPSLLSPHRRCTVVVVSPHRRCCVVVVSSLRHRHVIVAVLRRRCAVIVSSSRCVMWHPLCERSVDGVWRVCLRICARVWREGQAIWTPCSRWWRGAPLPL